jgi:hypothetical protein
MSIPGLDKVDYEAKDKLIDFIIGIIGCSIIFGVSFVLSGPLGAVGLFHLIYFIFVVPLLFLFRERTYILLGSLIFLLLLDLIFLGSCMLTLGKVWTQ